MKKPFEKMVHFHQGQNIIATIFGNMTNYTYIALLISNHALATAGPAFFMVL